MEHQIGRICFREEGMWWVAYNALPDSPEGRVELARIQMRFVDSDTRRKGFINLVCECYADLVEEIAGHRPTFPEGPIRAPESERAKQESGDEEAQEGCSRRHGEAATEARQADGEVSAVDAQDPEAAG